MGTTAAVVAWLAITYSYRKEKHTIVAEVARRLKASDVTDLQTGHGLSADMTKAAKEIAQWCLWRWDGFLGFRAGSDSVGSRAGVWKDRFEGVRSSALLVAMASLNRTLCDNGMPSSDASGRHCIPCTSPSAVLQSLSRT